MRSDTGHAVKLKPWELENTQCNGVHIIQLCRVPTAIGGINTLVHG